MHRNQGVCGLCQFLHDLCFDKGLTSAKNKQKIPEGSGACYSPASVHLLHCRREVNGCFMDTFVHLLERTRLCWCMKWPSFPALTNFLNNCIFSWKSFPLKFALQPIFWIIVLLRLGRWSELGGPLNFRIMVKKKNTTHSRCCSGSRSCSLPDSACLVHLGASSPDKGHACCQGLPSRGLPSAGGREGKAVAVRGFPRGLRDCVLMHRPRLPDPQVLPLYLSGPSTYVLCFS